MYQRRQPPQLTRPLLGSSPNLSVAGSVLSDLSQGYLAEQGVLSGEAALAAGKKMTRPGFWAGPFDKAKYRTIQEGDLSRGRNMLESAFALAQVAAQRPETRASALVDFDTAQQEIFRGLAVPENAPRLTDEAKVMRARLHGITEKYTEREGVDSANAERKANAKKPFDYTEAPDMLFGRRTTLRDMLANGLETSEGANAQRNRERAAFLNAPGWANAYDTGENAAVVMKKITERIDLYAKHPQAEELARGEEINTLKTRIAEALIARDDSVAQAQAEAFKSALESGMSADASALAGWKAASERAGELSENISREVGREVGEGLAAKYDIAYYRAQAASKAKLEKEREAAATKARMENATGEIGGFLSDAEFVAENNNGRLGGYARGQMLVEATAQAAGVAADVDSIRAEWVDAAAAEPGQTADMMGTILRRRILGDAEFTVAQRGQVESFLMAVAQSGDAQERADAIDRRRYERQGLPMAGGIDDILNETKPELRQGLMQEWIATARREVMAANSLQSPDGEKLLEVRPQLARQLSAVRSLAKDEGTLMQLRELGAMAGANSEYDTGIFLAEQVLGWNQHGNYPELATFNAVMASPIFADGHTLGVFAEAAAMRGADKWTNNREEDAALAKREVVQLESEGWIGRTADGTAIWNPGGVYGRPLWIGEVVADWVFGDEVVKEFYGQIIASKQDPKLQNGIRWKVGGSGRAEIGRHEFNLIESRLQSADEPLYAVPTRGNSEETEYVFFDGGNPVADLQGRNIRIVVNHREAEDYLQATREETAAADAEAARRRVEQQRRLLMFR